MMCMCWCETPTDRPTFSHLREQLELLLARNRDYLDLSNFERLNININTETDKRHQPDPSVRPHKEVTVPSPGHMPHQDTATRDSIVVSDSENFSTSSAADKLLPQSDSVAGDSNEPEDHDSPHVSLMASCDSLDRRNSVSPRHKPPTPPRRTAAMDMSPQPPDIAELEDPGKESFVSASREPLVAIRDREDALPVEANVMTVSCI